MIPQYELDIIIRLLVGHIVGDFLLQPNRLVAVKRKNGLMGGGLYLHAFITSISVYVCLGIWQLWWLILALGFIHLCIDAIKIKLTDTIVPFLVDQLVHLVSLAAVYWWVVNYLPNAVGQTAQAWYYALAFMVVLQPSGIVIGKILQAYNLTPRKAKNAKVGVLIGYLERILIVIFIFVHHFEAIGFLVAAKSILRVSDVKKGGQSKAEYYLLGTLLSFAAAIITGIIFNQFM